LNILEAIRRRESAAETRLLGSRKKGGERKGKGRSIKISLKPFQGQAIGSAGTKNLFHPITAEMEETQNGGE